MTDYILELFCLVEGEARSKAFPVTFPVTKKSTPTMGDLREEIKRKMQPEFDDIAPNKLRLWIVSIPNGSPTTLDALNPKTELDEPREFLSKVFPKSPDRDTYLVVRRPPRGKGKYVPISFTSCTTLFISLYSTNSPLQPPNYAPR